MDHLHARKHPLRCSSDPLLLDMHQQNSWVLARTAWKAIVFQPGMIIGKVGTVEYTMVLESNAFGIYVWPMRCDKKWVIVLA